METEAELPLNACVPSEIAPSKNSTLPVAAPCATVAVKVTDSPNIDGLLFDATLVEEADLFTNCVSTEEALPLKSPDEL